MTAVASTPGPTLHTAESLDDDALRTLLAYPEGLRAPLLRANFIASIDGAVTFDGSGRKLGTATDRRVFRRLREVADVVLVGAATATAAPYVDMSMSIEAQAWRLAHGLPPIQPVAVVSSRGVVPPALLHATVPPIVLLSSGADRDAREALRQSAARVVELPGPQVSSAAIRTALGEMGLLRVLVEGGPTLFSRLVADGEIDELCLTTSPMMVVGPARRIAASDSHTPVPMVRRGILTGDDGTVIVRWARA
ncbi:MAG: dihydrofolate reductase family protein [Mycolicibacterium rufum]|nr:dihydrofolate reductase family protein [Mycolicibacterium rufum]